MKTNQDDTLTENCFEFFSSRLDQLSSYQREYQKKFQDELGFESYSGWHFPCSPFFVTECHARKIREDLNTLINLAHKLTDLIFSGSWGAHAAYLGLNTQQKDLIAKFAHRPMNQRVARPDVFLSEDSIKVLELNIDTGIGQISSCHTRLQYYKNNTVLSEYFSSNGIEVSYLNPLPRLADYLRRLPQPTWVMQSRRGQPNIFFDGFDKIENQYLHQALGEIFTCHPEDIQLQGQSLYVEKKKIKSVYRYFSPFQLLNRVKEFESILDCLSQNPEIEFDCAPNSLLMENKKNFLLFLNEENHRLFSEKERDAIRRCIPKTYLVEERSASEIEGNKDNYVLKKTASHSGKHVLIGNSLTLVEFQIALKKAISEGDWIAQELVKGREHPTIVLSEGKLHKVKIPFVAHPFLIDGDLCGIDGHIAIYDPNKKHFLNSPGHHEIGACAVALVH